MSSRRVLLLMLIATSALMGPSATASPVAAPPISARPAGAPPISARPASHDVVRFTFDGPSPLDDVTGHGHALTPVSRNKGGFHVVAHGSGGALAFPPPCEREPCPRIALRAVNAASLDPGTRPIRWGASVLLRADQTTKGENVLQKGFSAVGSQYKLQIDGRPGKPSCVLVDDTRPKIHIAKSGVTVADGQWHTLECRRSGKSLIVLVDGVNQGSTKIPANLSVRNHLPLSVGGKGSFTDNDQFQGILDDAWVAIGQGTS